MHKTALEAIDNCLPQTQCTQCGYPRCLEYAQALREGKADIDQCPPGGEITIGALARLLGVAPKPLNPRYGIHRPRRVAYIDEATCIGCTLCIQACPVDAIVGATKHMHTVVAEQCTGCELCLAPCPVDCIDLQAPKPSVAPPGTWPGYPSTLVQRARSQTARRLARLHRKRDARQLRERHRLLSRPEARKHLKREIAAAVARVENKQRQGK